MSMRLFLVCAILLVGCDLIPVPVFSPVDVTSPPPRPAPASPLVGLGNPFPSMYPADEVANKGPVHDLAVVDGRIYVGHGSTHSKVPNRPVYYDVAAGEWGVDPEVLHQEGVYSLELGPSGRLYGSADDAIGLPSVLMIRRELDGTWTERVADPIENHSRHTYEWEDPRTGETLVFIQNAAPHYPDVSVSYDGGETFVRYGYEAPSEDLNPLRNYTFFAFDDELYASSFRPQNIPGYPDQEPRPYLIRYTGDRDRPFELVSATRDKVFPGEGSQIDEVVQLGEHLVVASFRFYAGTALSSEQMSELPVPGRAMDLIRVGDAVYLLSMEEGMSALYVTRDGETVEEVATFDRRFTALEYVSGTFYFAESGGEAEHTLWAYPVDL